MSKFDFVAIFFLLCAIVQCTFADDGDHRSPKGLSLFKVVKFANEGCPASLGRNGTCYTAEECESKGGTSSSACASGFGVCCVFTPSCGAQTSENNTYLTESAFNTAGACTYKICECSTDICKLRFDFFTHSTVGPTVYSEPPDAGSRDAVGHCTTDTFSISSSGNMGSPPICGVNNGQHMLVEPGVDGCVEATFIIGGGSNADRNWDILVSQHKCGDDLAGPPECLQYMTGETGTIASFNYPIGATELGLMNTHLIRQRYNICIRRESGFCGICYSPTIVSMTEQSSFGLVTRGGNVRLDSRCNADYLVIAGATENVVTAGAVTTAFDPAVVTDTSINRICGSLFSADPAATVADTYDTAGGNLRSVCTRSVPFKVGFVTNANEGPGQAAMLPFGTLGFSLDYRQIPC